MDSNKGDIMPHHTFKVDFKVLVTVVKLWMDDIVAGRPSVWQKDGAPAHNSTRTQSWCAENMIFLSV